ncbi:hypothetical protein BDF19DRAFT_466406 [Syncephalis fuscata]|nr:hypothetical protein BDF19DRAFT_466406 [Syncephalis fuscata]
MTRTVRSNKDKLDRQSRNGTPDDPRQQTKKQGGGRGNWGTLEDDVALAKDELAQPSRQRRVVGVALNDADDAYDAYDDDGTTHCLIAKQ